jgi:hypothetical protein
MQDIGSIVALVIAAPVFKAGLSDPASFVQGLIIGLVLGVVLSEFVLPRLVDVWFAVRRHRGR